MIDVNAKSMAVIIGAWEQHQQHNIKECLSQIIKFIDSKSCFQVTVLGGNHVIVDQTTQGINKWYDASRRLFVEHQGIDWMRRYWASKDLGQVTWDTSIRDHAWNTECISIWEQWQLEYLLNHVYTDVKNVWYFGIGLGVRRDPIGWGHLCDSIHYGTVRSNIDILTEKNCLLHNTMDHPDFVKTTFTSLDFSNTDWCLVEDDIYVKSTSNWNPEIPNGF